MSQPKLPLLTLVLIGLVVLALAVVVLSQNMGGLLTKFNSAGRASAADLDYTLIQIKAALRGPDLLLGNIPQQYMYLPMVTR